LVIVILWYVDGCDFVVVDGDLDVDGEYVILVVE